MSTSTGKIGRLPARLRGKVNRMLYDNRPAEEILGRLKTEGVKGVSPQNLSAWKKHGYQGWLRIRERVEGMRLRRESARVLAEEAAGGEEGDGDLTLQSEGASYLAVDAIQEALETFEPGLLKDLLAKKPERFMDLVEALDRLRRGDQSYARLRMQFDQWRGRMKAIAEEARHKAGKEGGDLAKLAEAMDQVLGG